ENDTKKEENFFERFGLEVQHGNVEIGKTYPVYGMITKIIQEDPDDFIVEINFNIEARMQIGDADKVQLVKERAFEPGIFVSTVIANDPKIIVDCTTVVFGR